MIGCVEGHAANCTQAQADHGGSFSASDLAQCRTGITFHSAASGASSSATPINPSEALTIRFSEAVNPVGFIGANSAYFESSLGARVDAYALPVAGSCPAVDASCTIRVWPQKPLTVGVEYNFKIGAQSFESSGTPGSHVPAKNFAVDLVVRDVVQPALYNSMEYWFDETGNGYHTSQCPSKLRSMRTKKEVNIFLSNAATVSLSVLQCGTTPLAACTPLLDFTSLKTGKGRMAGAISITDSMIGSWKYGTYYKINFSSGLASGSAQTTGKFLFGSNHHITLGQFTKLNHRIMPVACGSHCGRSSPAWGDLSHWQGKKPSLGYVDEAMTDLNSREHHPTHIYRYV